MDTSKLITITIWATLAFIAYEVLKGFFGTSATTTVPSTSVANSTLANLENSFIGGLATTPSLGSSELLQSVPSGLGGSASDNLLDVNNGVADDGIGYAMGD